jgi:hypothetical protein
LAPESHPSSSPDVLTFSILGVAEGPHRKKPHRRADGERVGVDAASHDLQAPNQSG